MLQDRTDQVPSPTPCSKDLLLTLLVDTCILFKANSQAHAATAPIYCLAMGQIQGVHTVCTHRSIAELPSALCAAKSRRCGEAISVPLALLPALAALIKEMTFLVQGPPARPATSAHNWRREIETKHRERCSQRPQVMLRPKHWTAKVKH